MTYDRLLLWRDPVPRSGPENMAVDEWLLLTAREPVLRLYEWDGEWVSLGYFGRKRDAAAMGGEGGCRLVRRATGGGIVDHRIDRTYTLVAPNGSSLARAGGAESYRAIHSALAAAMQRVGVEARLLASDADRDSAACFEKPVAWDLVDGAGVKLAGAGQRRTRRGLLHQGSVVVPGLPDGLFESFARELGGEVETIRPEPPGGELAAMIEKIGSEAWLDRR